jgi:hypothetical protein
VCKARRLLLAPRGEYCHLTTLEGIHRKLLHMFSEAISLSYSTDVCAGLPTYTSIAIISLSRGVWV